MVETIVPVVHGTRSWIVSIVAFALGALATAAAVGLVLGALLPTGGGRALLAAGCLALAYAAAEVGLGRAAPPAAGAAVPPTRARALPAAADRPAVRRRAGPRIRHLSAGRDAVGGLRGRRPGRRPARRCRGAERLRAGPGRRAVRHHAWGEDV